MMKPGCVSDQRLHCVNDRSSTQRPTWPMSPYDSSTGMNSTGESWPCSSEFQRKSASAPAMSMVSAHTSGW